MYSVFEEVAFKGLPQQNSRCISRINTYWHISIKPEIHKNFDTKVTWKENFEYLDVYCGKYLKLKIVYFNNLNGI
jgi:hypothetical protein